MRHFYCKKVHSTSPRVGLKFTEDVAILSSPVSGISCLDCHSPHLFDIYFDQRSNYDLLVSRNVPLQLWNLHKCILVALTKLWTMSLDLEVIILLRINLKKLKRQGWRSWQSAVLQVRMVSVRDPPVVAVLFTWHSYMYLPHVDNQFQFLLFKEASNGNKPGNAGQID